MLGRGANDRSKLAGRVSRGITQANVDRFEDVDAGFQPWFQPSDRAGVSAGGGEPTAACRRAWLLPSSGLALTGRALRRGVAMTGELSWPGHCAPAVGVRSTLAAVSGGRPGVISTQANQQNGRDPWTIC